MAKENDPDIIIGRDDAEWSRPSARPTRRTMATRSRRPAMRGTARSRSMWKRNAGTATTDPLDAAEAPP